MEHGIHNVNAYGTWHSLNAYANLKLALPRAYFFFNMPHYWDDDTMKQRCQTYLNLPEQKRSSYFSTSIYPKLVEVAKGIINTKKMWRFKGFEYDELVSVGVATATEYIEKFDFTRVKENGEATSLFSYLTKSIYFALVKYTQDFSAISEAEDIAAAADQQVAGPEISVLNAISEQQDFANLKAFILDTIHTMHTRRSKRSAIRSTIASDILDTEGTTFLNPLGGNYGMVAVYHEKLFPDMLYQNFGDHYRVTRKLLFVGAVSYFFDVPFVETRASVIRYTPWRTLLEGAGFEVDFSKTYVERNRISQMKRKHAVKKHVEDRYL
jgi:hypothetical protein